MSSLPNAHTGGDQPLEISDLAYVYIHADGTIAQRCYLLFEFVGRLRMRNVVDCDVRALPGQFEGNGLADSAVTTCDDSNFVLQKHEWLLGIRSSFTRVYGQSKQRDYPRGWCRYPSQCGWYRCDPKPESVEPC